MCKGFTIHDITLVITQFSEIKVVKMAAPGVKTRKDKQTGEHIAFSEAAGRNNAAIVEYCRTSMAALSGSTAGLLGLTGLSGFIFYFITAFVLWLMLLVKAGTQWKKYIINRQSLLTNGLFGGIFTYILFWTFIYGMVHVY